MQDILEFQDCFPQWGIYKTTNGFFLLPLSITSEIEDFVTP